MLPIMHLDHIYFSDEALELEYAELYRSRTALLASDHSAYTTGTVDINTLVAASRWRAVHRTGRQRCRTRWCRGSCR